MAQCSASSNHKGPFEKCAICGKTVCPECGGRDYILHNCSLPGDRCCQSAVGDLTEFRLAQSAPSRHRPSLAASATGRATAVC